ncbi:MAG: iron-sulfur cluster assembly protein [Alphaproteobacteria bacterium]|nr:iron-sulfur cluster assembly protein [Alphaproteobacteria bacterium]
MTQSEQTQIAEMTERVVEALRSVYDPEIPVNVYDLGLIYMIDVQNIQNEKPDVLIEMTLTTANCPMADMIPGMVYDAVTDRIPDLNEIKVKLVWEPAWDPSRMSEEARFELDML